MSKIEFEADDSKYADLLLQAESSTEYWAQTAIVDFTEDLAKLMQGKGITRAEFARRIEASPAYVTKVLRGNANFTLQTMSKLALAVGAVVRVHLTPVGR